MTLIEALKEKGLTEVEIEVMVMLRTDPASNEVLAERLFRTKRAIQWRVFKAMRKLGFDNRPEAILWMAQFPLT